MHNAYMLVLDSLCYLAHNPRRDRMYYAYVMHVHSRRDHHDMISRSPICSLNRSRA